MMSLGKARLGDKGPKGEPRKLDKFRFTSASKDRLDAIAERYGGEVREWEAHTDKGYFEVYTDTAELAVVLPPVFSAADGKPTYPLSQFMEMWSAGGCQRRCDGVTMLGPDKMTGKPCACNPEARTCKPTTRISFMMPDIPGLGVWWIESKGYNAAAEMPETVEILARQAAEGMFVGAVLRAEKRSKVIDGKTMSFIVPVIDLPNVSVNQLASGDVPLAINAPPAPAERPALPAPKENGALPVDPSFTDEEETPEFGSPPPLPTPAKKPTKADRDKLVKITTQLGEIDPATDWPGLVERAASSSFGHGVEDLSKDELTELLARLVKHAETINPPVPA
jgi:hypothetical protein